MPKSEFNWISVALRQIILFSILCMHSCKNLSQVNQDHQYTNALINETSPYLLQHAHNPVDWHPWGTSALEKAKKENKLLIISIGYAACHWCHVMEHESFEDSLIASIMNEHFVPIKVDREERPDVDDIYMSAAQLLTGSGGWPLNAFALPDGRPVWAGTYFPKDKWEEILKRFAYLKENEWEKLESSANQLTSGIASLDEVTLIESAPKYSANLLKDITGRFLAQVDLEEGGRKGAPKFPMPNNWEFLLKYAVKSSDQQMLSAVTNTLDKMAYGGIYDQVGGGFARYSVDAIWKAPHFEKMLYDNGQLLSLYAQAYQATQRPLYKKVVEETIDFLNRELYSVEDGFYSSLDADSEGEEGKFYVWKDEELDELIINDNDRALIKEYYSTLPEGNWEHGNNILHIKEGWPELLKRYSVSAVQLDSIIKHFKQQALTARAKRPRPGLDDKILTSWNALIIKGYIDAYKAIGKEEYLEQAIMTAHFVLKNQMQDDSRLNRNYKNGQSTINAFLDDYANLIYALTSLYEVTMDESWLNISKELLDYTIAHFFNPKNGMFNYTSDLDPALIARKMELSDNVIPGSNSMMARNLHLLGEIFYYPEYTEKAEQMLNNMMPNISQINQPSFYSNWLQLLFDIIYPPYEIVVIGEDAEYKSKEIFRNYMLNNIVLASSSDSNLPLLLNKYVEGETMIYVCQNKVCKLPVTEVEDALSQLK